MARDRFSSAYVEACSAQPCPHLPNEHKVNDLLNHFGETFRLAPGEIPTATIRAAGPTSSHVMAGCGVAKPAS